MNFHNLDDTRFEEMCRLLVAEEHPGAIAIEPLQGDEGIDSFAGVIDEAVEQIWQFKFFETAIGKVQRDQIRKSLVKAIHKHKPKTWTLITSADMSTTFLRWLNKQREDYPNVTIEVIPATQVRRLLIKHQGVRQVYFPLGDEKMNMLLQAAGAKGQLSDKKPKAAALNDMHERVAIVNDGSPDFKFVVTDDEDCQTVTVLPRHEGANGKTVLNMGLRFSTKDKEESAALEEYQRNLREGRPLTLDGRYVTIKESVFDDLMGEGFKLATFTMKPEVPSVETPMRVTAQWKDKTVSLNYLAMRLVRQGTEDFELSNAHDAAALLTFGFTFRYDGSASTVHFQLRDYDGKKPSQVIEAERFLNLVAKRGATLQMVNLRDNQLIGDATVSSLEEVVSDDRLRFYEDLLVLEQRVNPDIVIHVDAADVWDAALTRWLSLVATGEVIFKSQTVTLEVDAQAATAFRSQMAEHKGKPLQLFARMRETAELFGVPYTTHTRVSVAGVPVLKNEQPDGSATVEIPGDLSLKVEKILPNVRLEDEEDETEGETE